MFLFYRSQIRPWLSYSIVQFGKILCSDSTHPPPFLLTPQEFAVLEGNEAYVTVCECLKTVRGNFVKSLKGGKAEGGGERKERYPTQEGDVVLITYVRSYTVAICSTPCCNNICRAIVLESSVFDSSKSQYITEG